MSPTPSPFNRWALNFIIVLAAFLVVDVLFYFWLWKNPNPYLDGIGEKLMYTAGFSAIYAHLYDKVSQRWQIAKGLPKWVNGLVFNIIFCFLILMAIGLLIGMASVVHIYILHAFRGIIPPPEARQSVVFATQVVIAGTGLSLVGKTEDNPR